MPPLVILFALFPNLILSIYTDIPDLREASIPSLWVLCSAYLILVPANVYFQAVSERATHVRRWDWNSVYWPFIDLYHLYDSLSESGCSRLAGTTEHLYGICILFLSYLYKERKLAEKADLT